MQIAIVEDNSKSRERLVQVVQNGILAMGYTAGITSYASRACIQAPLPADTGVVFIGINSMTAVEAARQIVYLNEGVKLVIVSKSPEYGMEGVRLGARHYLLEPLEFAEVEQALYRCL